jgi:serine/threonine-protein kinase
VPPLQEPDLGLAALARVLSSTTFHRAERSSTLLRFLVERTIAGQADGLKEYTIGAEALGRGASFDPRTDTIVRAEASRLRTRLERYYETDGQADPVAIVLPKGGYVPRFVPRSDVTDGSDRMPAAPLRWWMPWAVGALGLTAATWLMLVWSDARVSPVEDAAVSQFDVELRSGGELGSQVGTDVILSPDGNRMVFVSRDAMGLAHLYTRRLDQAAAVRLPGTEGARSAFISPDGGWVGFWAGGFVKKVPVGGGAPVVLCEAADLVGASWGSDGTIVAALDSGTKLWKIPESGGLPETLIDATAEGRHLLWPQYVSESQLVIYTALDGDADNATIEAFSIPDRKRAVLTRAGTFGRYLPTGHLTYVNQGTLYATRFDRQRLAVGGAPVPLLHDISYSRTFGYAQMDVSRNGTLAYRKDAESGSRVIAWIERGGRMTQLLSTPGRYSWPRLSPDGHSVAVSVADAGTSAIWIHDSRSGQTQRVATSPVDHSGLTWWPDGSALLFGGVGGLASIQAKSGAPTKLLTDGAITVPGGFSPDGQVLAYAEMAPGTAFDLWTVPIARNGADVVVGTPVPFLRTRAMETAPVFSTDGRWIAYASNESGVPEVYVRRFPDNGSVVKVSSAGGTFPRWSPNGREIVYRTSDRRIMVASFTVHGDTFSKTGLQPWGPQVLADTGVLTNFDVASDGERIAALTTATQPENEQTANHVTVMLNFNAEVRRRVPQK